MKLKFYQMFLMLGISFSRNLNICQRVNIFKGYKYARPRFAMLKNAECINSFDLFEPKIKFSRSPLLSSAVFFQWSESVVNRRCLTDKEFIRRLEVRELKKCDRVLIAEKGEYEARIAYELHPNNSKLIQLDKVVDGLNKAVSSIQKFLGEGSASSNPETSQKLESLRDLLPHKIQDLVEYSKQRDLLRKETPEYWDLLAAQNYLKSVYESMGLTAALKNAADEVKDAGKYRNKRGRNFEETAVQALEQTLFPLLSKRYCLNISDIFIARNVKMGMGSNKGSSAELDYLICTQAARPHEMDQQKPKGTFCKVLAIVEAKRNPDDLGEAFVNLQRSLVWLSGCKEEYLSSLWRTKGYPKGHFDRPFIHGSPPLIFTAESFAGLREARKPTMVSKNLLAAIQGQLTEEAEEDATIESAGAFSMAGVSLGLKQISCHADKGATGSDSLQSETSGGVSVDESQQLTHLFLDGIFFVCLDGNLEGLPSKTAAWVCSKIASEPQFDLPLGPHSTEVLEELRIRSLDRFPPRLSTPELIRLYRANGALEQVVVLADSRVKEPVVDKEELDGENPLTAAPEAAAPAAAESED